MTNNKGRILIGIIIAVILIAILVFLICVGMMVMNTVEKENNESKNNGVANAGEPGNSLANKKLEDLVYDAEFDYKTGINGFTYTTNEWGSTIETTHTYVKNSTEIEGQDLKTFSFPYVNIDSEYAEEINKEVDSLYEYYLGKFKERIKEIRDTNDIEDLEEREYARYQGDYIEVENDIVNYEAYLNGDILSIVIIEGPFTHIGYKYRVYNIDVGTGKEVSPQDIIAKSKYANHGELREAIKEEVDDVLIEFYSSNGGNIEEMQETIKENVDTTINEYIFRNSNELVSYGAYFNEDNNLCFIFETYTGWGKEVQQYIYELE